MDRKERIEAKIQEKLAPTFLTVTNDSHAHNVPKGSETHFNVVIVSEAFADKSHVARHQLVYATLADELKSGLHALAITSRTPSEWASKEGARVNESPECLGGSKR